VLAVQIPDNMKEPSHTLMDDVAGQGAWAGRLAKASAARQIVPPAEAYYRRLKPFFTSLDIWHTIYNHPLAGAQGIAEWMKSTGLRPYLNPLDTQEQREFVKAYETGLGKAYPAGPDGMVLLRFPRLFIVGVR
jgi:trans-aconitate 2-methyltransferase